jgi:hypothetical protein
LSSWFCPSEWTLVPWVNSGPGMTFNPKGWTIWFKNYFFVSKTFPDSWNQWRQLGPDRCDFLFYICPKSNIDSIIYLCHLFLSRKKFYLPMFLLNHKVTDPFFDKSVFVSDIISLLLKRLFCTNYDLRCKKILRSTEVWTLWPWGPTAHSSGSKFVPWAWKWLLNTYSRECSYRDRVARWYIFIPKKSQFGYIVEGLTI